MSSSTRGASTSPCEVTNISAVGFWLFVDGSEYFIPFSSYPEFLKATVPQICGVRRNRPDHFYWQDIDVDIELDALKRPEDFPLKFTRKLHPD